MPLTFRERLSLAVFGLKASVGRGPEDAVDTVLNRVKRGQQGDPPSRGASGVLDAYLETPWVRACAGRVADSMSSVQWKLYVTRKSPTARAYRHRSLQYADYTQRHKMLKMLDGAGEIEEVTDHPFIDIMTRGNGFHTGAELRRIESVHMDLVGESFQYKGRNTFNTTVALWPIPPTWVMATPTPDFPFFRISHKTWQEMVPQADILWQRDVNPKDPYGRGAGLGRAISDEIEIDEFAAKTTRQVFFNRAQPDFLVFPKGDADMDSTETKRFEQNWVNKLQGFYRTSKPHFLSREVGIYEFQKNLKDMMLTEIRQQERDIILQVWGMPPEKLGILSNSNRATIEGSDLIYAKEVLVPRLEARRMFFQERMIPEYDDRLIVHYESPVMEDREFFLKAAEKAPYVLDGNEWRYMMGLDPRDELEDLMFVPPAVTPVRLSELADVEPPKLDLGPPPEVEPPDDEDDADDDVGEDALGNEDDDTA